MSKNQVPIVDKEEIERKEQRDGLMVWLAENLFGWKEIRYEGEGFGPYRPARSDPRRSAASNVRGWYGIAPDGFKPSLFPYSHMASALEQSRVVIKRMADRGFGIHSYKSPTGDWFCEFTEETIVEVEENGAMVRKRGKPIGFGAGNDASEAHALCKAAYFCLRTKEIKEQQNGEPV